MAGLSGRALAVRTPATSVSWIDGGLGKARYGTSDGAPAVRLGGSWRSGGMPTSAWLAVADVQAQSAALARRRRDRGLPALSAGVDLALALVGCAPARSSRRCRSRTTASAGPVRWTLTPSAINTLGRRGTARHRRRSAARTSRASAARWSSDWRHSSATIRPANCSRRAAGRSATSPRCSNSRLRQPDVHADRGARQRAARALNRSSRTMAGTGWQADLAWRSTTGRRYTLIRYDNRADPESFSRDGARKVFSWRTRFTGAGRWNCHSARSWCSPRRWTATRRSSRVRACYMDTRFDAGYVLVGWDPRRVASGPARGPVLHAPLAGDGAGLAQRARTRLDRGPQLAAVARHPRDRRVAADRQQPRPAPARRPGRRADRVAVPAEPPAAFLNRRTPADLSAAALYSTISVRLSGPPRHAAHHQAHRLRHRRADRPRRRARSACTAPPSWPRRARLELPTVSKVLKPLAQAGLVTGFRGATGGYDWRATPAQISLIEIVEAIEGRLGMTECSGEHSQLRARTALRRAGPLAPDQRRDRRRAARHEPGRNAAASRASRPGASR